MLVCTFEFPHSFNRPPEDDRDSQPLVIIDSFVKEAVIAFAIPVQ
jgi:hypothetical protein